MASSSLFFFDFNITDTHKLVFRPEGDHVSVPEHSEMFKTPAGCSAVTEIPWLQALGRFGVT